MNELLVWGLVLLGGALMLLFLELFLPSAGLIAIAATICAVIGLVLLYRFDTTWGALATVVTLIVGPAIMIFGLSIWKNTPIGRRVIGAPTEEEVAKKIQEESRKKAQRQEMVGKEGVAITDLRPVGVVQIGSERHDASSETGFVESGARIRVTGADPQQLRVRTI